MIIRLNVVGEDENRVTWCVGGLSLMNHVSALKQLLHANGEQSQASVLFPLFFPRSSDFRRVAPLYCSLQGKHVDFAAWRGSFILCREYINNPQMHKVYSASFLCFFNKLKYMHPYRQAHTLSSCAYNNFKSNRGWVQHFSDGCFSPSF